RTATSASWRQAEITARSSASSARSLSAAPLSSGIVLPLDARATSSKFVLDLLVAAIEVINAVDYRLALCDETRHHERYRGAQVRRHHRRPHQAWYPPHQGGGAVNGDVGSHARELGDMHEAVLENGFGDHRRASSDRHQRH